ncbi:glycosyltransferase family 1 protein, partial [Candidatus Bathyarchaeota archaeon]
GIDVEKYSPEAVSEEERKKVRESLGVKDDELMILFIGRLTWVKGADMLLQAMPHILRDVPNAKLVIVGVGDQQDLLKNDVAKMGLEDKVILKFDFLAEDVKIGYYAASDVCVFPSKYEPFGIVCTEAMAMGKPVVVGARDISGLREQVISSGEKQCGFHINPYDPSDIAKFTSILLLDEEMRMKFGRNARERVLNMFTWEKVSQDTLRIYRELVE